MLFSPDPSYLAQEVSHFTVRVWRALFKADSVNALKWIPDFSAAWQGLKLCLLGVISGPVELSAGHHMVRLTVGLVPSSQSQWTGGKKKGWLLHWALEGNVLSRNIQSTRRTECTRNISWNRFPRKSHTYDVEWITVIIWLSWTLCTYQNAIICSPY